MRILLSSVMALFLSVMSISCGDGSDDSNGGQVVVNPQSTPAPTPSPSPISRSWRQVIDESYTDMISPQECENPRLLFISSQGRYVAGPCLQGERKKRGTITHDELAELDRRIRILMSNDLTDPAICDPEGPIAGNYVDLELPPGAIYRVYDAQPGRTCYRGDKTAVTQLMQYVTTLRQKYYPWHPSP